MHLDHQQCKYEFVTNKDSKAQASTRTTYSGWYIIMFINSPFWEEKPDAQIRCLIHEHIHACLIPYDQQVLAAVGKLHLAEKEMWEEAIDMGCEISVCHLESVLFDLLRDKF